MPQTGQLRDETPDTRLTNMWRFQAKDIPAGWVQEVDEPDVEYLEDAFSDGRIDKKVTTGAKFGDLTLRKLVCSDRMDKSVYDIMIAGFNPETGVIGAPSATKFDAVLAYVDGAGNDIVKLNIEGMRLKKRTGMKLVKKADGAKVMMEEVVFSIDAFTKEAAGG